MSIALAAPMASTSPDGVWSPACYAHRKFDECLVGGKTFNDAFASWYVRGQQVKLADTCGILCNPTCPDYIPHHTEWRTHESARLNR